MIGQFKVFLLLMQITVIFSAIPKAQKCHLQDSNCIKSAAQQLVLAFANGMPDVGTEPLDPMHVDVINEDLAGLKLTIRNVEIKGIRNAVIDSISVDMNNKLIVLVFHADFVLKGKYKASGKLLILPISGDGDTTIKLKNCQITLNMDFNIVKDNNGKDIFDLKRYRFVFDVRDSAQYRLGNLFNGNKDLSDSMHTFMNSNWKVLTEEFGYPVFEKPVEKIFKSIKAYLKLQPLEEVSII